MATAVLLPSGHWRCQAYAGVDAEGKKIKKSFTAVTKEEAERKAGAFQLHRFAADQTGITLDEAMTSYMKENEKYLDAKTKKRYRTYCRVYFSLLKDIPVTSMTTKGVRKYLRALSISHSTKNVLQIYTFLSGVLLSVGVELNAKALPKQIRNKKGKMMTNKEVKTLLLVASARTDRALYQSLLLNIFSGLRRKDICRIVGIKPNVLTNRFRRLKHLIWLDHLQFDGLRNFFGNNIILMHDDSIQSIAA